MTRHESLDNDEPATAELRTDLEREIAERNRAEAKVQHLTGLLRAIRNVSQLVARETDRQRLLQGTCDCLTEARGYRSTWIALLDESRKLTIGAEAGTGGDFQPLVEQMRRGELSDCGKKALSQPGVLTFDEPSSHCGDCPLAKRYCGGQAMAARLEYGGSICGLMVASISEDVVIDEEERGLFEEIAGDVAFALNSIQLEEERKLVGERLRASETRSRQIIDLVPHMIFAKDREGRFLLVNRALAEAYQTTVEELVGKRQADVHPNLEEARQILQDDRAVIDSGRPMTIPEECLVDTGGERHFFQVTKIPYAVPGTAARAVLGVAVDISELKRTEQALREAHEQLEQRVKERTAELADANEELKREIADRKQAEEDLAYERFLLTTLLEYAPDFVYFKDAESRFIRLSRGLANYYGLDDPSEATGKSDFDFYDAQQANQYRADEQEVIRTGRPVVDKEEEQLWPDGRLIWLWTSKVPLYSAEGEVIGTFGISRDITHRKQAEVQLQAAKEAAETANRAKSDFVANMSHEIRTPMNAIIGMTELVLDTELTDSQRDYLKMVRESGDSLLSLINDILDFSKIEAGKLDLDCAPFDVRESLGDTMKSMALRAHTKGLELACRIQPEVPDRLVGDVGRLRQIVVNLIGNAIKFTDAGEVILNVDRQSQSDDDDEVVLHFAVADTGIGIPEEKRAAIFDAFEQADSSTTRRFAGTGLGLAISTKLVGFMGGEIWVESEDGRGSTFHFTARFGLGASEAAGVSPVEPRRIRGTQVLVVDDNATNRLILEEMLRNWGMKPTAVASVPEALPLLAQALESGEPYALILTDANMPDADGFTLVESVKQDATLGSTIIMMLTSGDRPGDVARCEQLGVAAYLLKPIKQSELFDAIVMALGITTAEDEVSQKRPAAQPSRLRPLRILLAEDSLVNQKLAVGLLEKYGHTVLVVNHGREAIAALQSQDFDLILMDVQMPEMDGFEATAAIRASEEQTGTHIPIVAMTAHAMKGDRERCLEAGMDDYVAKPIRAKQLFDTIETVLRTSSESKTNQA